MLSFLLFVDMTFSLLTEMGGFFSPVSADPFCFLVCWGWGLEKTDERWNDDITLCYKQEMDLGNRNQTVRDCLGIFSRISHIWKPNEFLHSTSQVKIHDLFQITETTVFFSFICSHRSYRKLGVVPFDFCFQDTLGKPLVELAAVPCPTIPENNKPESDVLFDSKEFESWGF